MRSSIAVAAMLAALATAAPASAQTQCIVEASPAIFGVNMYAVFDIGSGQSCSYGVQLRGTIASSQISQPARHGTARMLDLATFLYQAPPGFTGEDSFSITASGQSLGEQPGTSVIQVRVNVR